VSDLIKVENLKVDIRVPGGIIQAVKDASFRIRPGSTVALVGESGSGKSIICQAIMGILPEAARISGGRILFDDPEAQETPVDIAALPSRDPRMRAIRGGRISLVFQDAMSSLSQLHTIGDQIGEALHLHRNVSAKEGKEIIETMLRLVGFPNPSQAPKFYPFELSGGMRQRAMVAMALVSRPALMIADEPTTALDVSIQAHILSMIKDVQAELGMAMLIVTHDLGVVANVAEEVVVIYQGSVMESGTVQDIFRNPGHEYLKGLFKAVPHFDMHNGERLVPLREIDTRSQAMIMDKEPWPDGADAAGPILRVSNLRKTFVARKGGLFSGGKQTVVNAVRNVNFEIQRGECFGLVGESSCGKTTLSKLIMRATGADEGQVQFNNRGKIVDLQALSSDELLPIRQKIQMIFQDPFSSLNPRMTVFDIIREPLVIHRIGDAASQAETVKQLMSVVGLDPRFLNRYPHSFSGGQCQRIGIARALALKPDFLICDEPVSALDVSIQAQILNLLKDLQDELGLTYLFISHNLAVVDYIAGRIAVMCRGRIVEMAPREVLFKNPVHPYTQSLMSAVPYPDLDRPLNFETLSDEVASDPTAWPAPFLIDHEGASRLVDLGGGHIVLTANDVEPRELTA